MRNTLTAVLWLLLSILAGGIRADAAEPRKVALLVGVNDYLKPGFKPLLFAEADVLAVGEELKKLGFEVTILLGSDKAERRATRANIEAAAHKMVTPLGQSDVALVMLSGHGQQLNPEADADPDRVDFDATQSFYCPVDAVANRPETQFSLSHLVDDILAPNVGRKLLLVDACRDVPVNRTRGRNAKGVEGRVVSLPEGTGVFFSCSAGQTSFERDELGHGLFTYCVLEGLRGKAVIEDEISWSSLVTHVNRRMHQQELTQYMPDKLRQIPISAGAMPYTVLGRLTLRPGDATPAPQPASPRPTMRPERPVATPTPPPRRSYSPRTLNDASLTDNDATSTVRLIAQMVERFHITRPKLDDQVSRKVFDAYLRDLDPERLFFLESDMTQLSAFRTTLDDELKAGQTTFPYRAYGILSVRIREACDEADWLIDQPLESLLPATPERSTSGWAQTSDQRTDRWRRLLYSQLATCIGDEDLNAKRKQLHDRYQFLVSTMLLRDKLYVFESYLTAFVRTFDPHAAYVSSRSQQAIDAANELRSSLAAPGLLVTETEGRAYANLLSPHGLSQEEALLMDGAQIVGIGEASGQSRGTASIRETTGLPRERIQQLLTGKPGSFVAIEVVPSTESARRVVTMKRDFRLVSDDKVRGTTIDTRSRLGRSGKIGVLRIPSFYGAPRDSRGKPTNTGGAAGDVARILDQFERDVIEAVVIDLRRSGGGDVNQAVEVGGLFLPGGPVVQRSEPATGSVSILEDLTTDAKCRAPVIVLCDRLTRGEAEVLASSLSDHRRAIIVGDSHTFGMGTEPMQMSVAPTQMFRGLSGTDRGNLRLATSRYYRPSGDAFQQRGVTADVVLPSLLDQFDVGEKALADSLPFDRINPASFRATNYVTAQVVSDLKIKSAARIENNSGFADTRGLIQSWNTRNEQSGPPFAVRTTLERDPSLPSDEFTRQIGAAGDTLLPASYYHDEVLSIALDYVALLGG